MARLVIGTNKTATTPAVVKKPTRYVEMDTVTDNNKTTFFSFKGPLNLDGIDEVQTRLAYMFSGAIIAGPACINTSNVKKFENTVFDHTFYGTSATSTGLDFANTIILNSTTSSTTASFAYAFQWASNLTSTGFENVEHILRSDDNEDAVNNTLCVPYAYPFYHTFDSCNSLTTTGLSNLKTIKNLNANSRFYFGFSYMFGACTGLTSTGLGNLEEIVDKYAPNSTSNFCYVFYYTFQNCTSLTTTGLTKLRTIDVGGPAFHYTFSGCTGLTTTGIDWANLNVTVRYYASGNSCSSGAFAYTFQKCSGLTTTGFSGMKRVSAACFYNTFTECTNLTSTETEDIEYIGQWGFRSIFSKCTGLTVCRFSSLTDVQDMGLYYAFDSCSNLANVYFPALKSHWYPYSNIGCFSMMLKSISGCTVHFPANLQSEISGWSSVTGGFGGTNTTVLWDLPSTFTLTGANSNSYERNPKYDTQTSLAWYDTSSTRATSYYTNGTTDPSVSDTIYSDSACTTAVTTISSIA